MTTQRHTTNPTKIITIPKGDVNIRLVRNAATRAIERFTLEKLSVSSLASLPADSRIAIIAKARYSEMKFDAGTKQAPKPLKDVALSDIDKQYPLHLRIIVFDENTKKIVASCERIRIYESEEGGIKSLLPVEPAELGEQMWRLSVEEGERPILQVNADPNVGLLDKISSDPFCQSIILPEAIRGALLHLLRTDADEDESDSWQSRWIRYLDTLGIDLPEIDNTESDTLGVRRWTDDAVAAISKHLSLRTKYAQSLAEGNV